MRPSPAAAREASKMVLARVGARKEMKIWRLSLDSNQDVGPCTVPA